MPRDRLCEVHIHGVNVDAEARSALVGWHPSLIHAPEGPS
jgi:hypothetical protein